MEEFLGLSNGQQLPEQGYSMLLEDHRGTVQKMGSGTVKEKLVHLETMLGVHWI